MPALRRQILDSRLKLICLFLLASVIYLLHPAVAYATTDPKTSTPSATATVPSFVVPADEVAPTSPILLRPADNATLSDPHPEFVWRPSTDPNGNTIVYTVYLNNIATYLGISNLGNSSGANYTARIDGNEVKLLPTVDLPDGTYQWYVTATDTTGNTARSATWTLTIDTLSPPLTLLDLDIYHLPIIVADAIFDIAGPKDVYFTFLTDPFSQISLTLVNQATSAVFLLRQGSASNGQATLYQHLDLGTYRVTAASFDPAGNSTLLPDFFLQLTQSALTVPGLPPLEVPSLIHDLPATLTHLPATIAQLETRTSLAVYLLVSLAVSIIILLFLFWKRRINLLLIDSDLRPLPHATIYHSLPPHQSRLYQLSPNDRGRLSIAHLTRYSTLTVRVVDNNVCTTHILSISTPARFYTIVL